MRSPWLEPDPTKAPPPTFPSTIATITNQAGDIVDDEYHTLRYRGNKETWLQGPQPTTWFPAPVPGTYTNDVVSVADRRLTTDGLMQVSNIHIHTNTYI